MTIVPAFLLPGALCCGAQAADTVSQSVSTPSVTAEMRDGVVIGLSDADGHSLAVFTESVESLTCLHRIDGAVSVGAAQTREFESLPEGLEWRFAGFADLPGTDLRTRVTAEGGEIAVRQTAECPQQNLWGVEWSISGIPLERSIIVAGHSGVRLTSETPGSWFTFDYPMAWEAPLVIVEGEGTGWYVWARDPDMQFKRLTVERKPAGWRLRFISMAHAPFENSAALVSPEWRLGGYTGDWRVPARRYRDWMVRAYGPVPAEEQQPPWVKDIRCCVIMGLNLEVLENLGTTLDPAQTIVYVPSWRSQGYDRDYPDYDQVYDGLKPFVERAHALGFKVMLHVNYFGVDPLNPLYGQFEPYQVRSPWGTHEKEWWLWTRAEPEIKFAYINPAHKAWRDLFTARMAGLCTEYAVDALHLDQTLCIYNDHNGRIDGMTMAEGNIALHQQLREALPGIALSGEGLNEVTFRLEAFAQRHAWGLRHSEGTWDRAMLEAAHPICSYLFRPYTIITGYLGCAPPTEGQLYAAWNEAYEHWGIIPTLKPSSGKLDRPDGFVRQFRDEVAFWFEARPELALEDPWPDTVAFPYRSAAGERVVRTTDHQLVAGERVISRTISGVDHVTLPGTIPGWQAYDKTRIFGLDPEAWYPYFDEPRDLTVPHLASIPEEFCPAGVLLDEDAGIVRSRQRGGVVANIAALLGGAVRGSRHRDGSEHLMNGEGPTPDGAAFEPHGAVIHAHPPWKDGTGQTYARFEITLPGTGDLYFESTVAMDKGAVGKTDGAIFSVRAESGGQVLEEAVHTDTDTPVPLHLDLTLFAGRTITLELAVDPGPESSPTYDWARWFEARVIRRLHITGTLKLEGPVSYTYAAAGGKLVQTQAVGGGLTADVAFPGPVYFVAEAPMEIAPPFDLATGGFKTVFMDSLGHRLEAPPHATARSESGRVSGTAVTGLFVHPPNEGSTIVLYFLVLPPAPSTLEASVGLREGAQESNGAVCSIEVNGQEVARTAVLPEDGLIPMRAGLEQWAGKPVVVALLTDSAGSYTCDWVLWGSPRIQSVP